MGGMGFIVPELPEQFGGLGLGCLAAGVIHEEIARADLSISYVNLLASLNGQILSSTGQPEVVTPWLQRLIAGEALRHRADRAARRIGRGQPAAEDRSPRVGDEYVINGEKTSISAADQADAAVVFGRTGTPIRCARRHGAAGADGHASVTTQPLRLPRPARHRARLALLRERARARTTAWGREPGLRAGDAGLRLLTLAHRPAGAGGGAAALEETWRYVTEREAFGKPLAAFQGVTHPLATYDTR